MDFPMLTKDQITARARDVDALIAETQRVNRLPPKMGRTTRSAPMFAAATGGPPARDPRVTVYRAAAGAVQTFTAPAPPGAT